MQLPNRFCWSRFGTEAGEEIQQILARKERERSENNGIFLWGVGSALRPSMLLLTQQEAEPEVIFSPIKSSPRKADVAPSKIARWTTARNLDGEIYTIPRASVVTSRAKEGRTQRHYALVCFSEKPLQLQEDLGELTLGRIRNLATNNPIGASQVSAVVKHSKNSPIYSTLVYPIAMRFKLAAPYFIELHDPVVRQAA